MTDLGRTNSGPGFCPHPQSYSRVEVNLANKKERTFSENNCHRLVRVRMYWCQAMKPGGNKKERKKINRKEIKGGNQK